MATSTIVDTLDALWGDLDLSSDRCPTAGCQRIGWISTSTPDERPLCLDCRLRRDGFPQSDIDTFRRAARYRAQRAG